MLLKKLNQTNIFLLKVNGNNLRIKRLFFLKKILYDYYDINIHIYDIFYNYYGKPFLKEIYFNISYTKEYIILAVGNCCVGVDIEQKRKVSDNIIHKIMDYNEYNFYKNDDNYILKTWVYKEAYVKYIGTGIIMDFNKIKLSEIRNRNHVAISDGDFYLVVFSDEIISKKINKFNEENMWWYDELYFRKNI